MLDDFLFVVPRKEEESDENCIQRGHREAAKFDKLLSDLKLPRATEKDQKSQFPSNLVRCSI